MNAAEIVPSPGPVKVDQDEFNLRKSPLWELGLGGGGTFTPDYPASDQQHLWAIPFPYAIYRGEILHSDRRGSTRARFYKTTNYEFNFSAGGGLPSSSAQNAARAGMPDLEWLGELGPRLTVDLYSKPERSLLRFGLPFRMAFSSNFEHLRDQGWVIAPELLYDLPHIFGSRFDAFALLTVNFSDRRFANYFYGVEPAYARPERPPYAARGGYLNSDLSFGLAMPLLENRLRLFTVGAIQSFDGSANQASPLYRTTLSYSFSTVIIWVFARSDDKVHSED